MFGTLEIRIIVGSGSPRWTTCEEVELLASSAIACCGAHSHSRNEKKSLEQTGDDHARRFVGVSRCCLRVMMYYRYCGNLSRQAAREEERVNNEQ